MSRRELVQVVAILIVGAFLTPTAYFAGKAFSYQRNTQYCALVRPDERAICERTRVECEAATHAWDTTAVCLQVEDDRKFYCNPWEPGRPCFPARTTCVNKTFDPLQLRCRFLTQRENLSFDYSKTP